MHLIRASSLAHFPETAQEHQLDPEQLLRRQGLSVAMLADPDAPLPALAVAQVLEAAAAASGNESFTLQMVGRRRLSDLGALGLLLRDQATVRDALELLRQHQARLSTMVSFGFDEDEGLARVSVWLHGPPETRLRQMAALPLAVLAQLLRTLLDADWVPVAAVFRHPEPKDRKSLEGLFGPELHFDQDREALVFQAADLDRATRGSDPRMVRYSRQLLSTPLFAHSLNGLIEAARSAILTLLPTGRCHAERLAQHLGLSPRTLQRQLAAEGLSYSSLVQSLRRELAEQHVQHGTLPLQEVAELLGFSASSAFSRWYAQEFGLAPSRARTDQTDGADAFWTPVKA